MVNSVNEYTAPGAQIGYRVYIGNLTASTIEYGRTKSFCSVLFLGMDVLVSVFLYLESWSSAVGCQSDLDLRQSALLRSLTRRIRILIA